MVITENADDLLLQSFCPKLRIRPTLMSKTLGTELVISFSNWPKQKVSERAFDVETIGSMFVTWFRENIGPEGIDWGLHHIDHRVIFHLRNERIAMQFKLRFL